MALQFMDGFDAGDPQIKNWSGAVASANSSPSPRFGVGRYAYTGTLFQRQITASSQVIVGAALGASNVTGIVCPYITFFGDSGVTQHITVGFSGTTLQAIRGGLGGTVLATYSSVFVSNTFYNVEISATISDAGGSVVVKYNGTTVINFTGDTKNGGTSTNIDAVGCGVASGVVGYFDDLYICDSTGSAPYNTFLGDVRVHTIVPDGAGSSTQLTPSTGANYTTVDELPYSATDYVYGTAGQTDLYTASNLPGGTGVIYGVQTSAIVKKTDAGNISARPALKSGASTYYGSSVSIGTSDQVVLRTDQVNPATSAAWTSSEVNGIEIGIGAV